MKVIEHIEKANNPIFSFEIIPPKRGTNVQEIIDIVKDLQSFNPPYIDVTSHSAEAYYEEDGEGMVKRHIRKKRPGTISICGIIQNRFKLIRNHESDYIKQKVDEWYYELFQIQLTE